MLFRSCLFWATLCGFYSTVSFEAADFHVKCSWCYMCVTPCIPRLWHYVHLFPTVYTLLLDLLFASDLGTLLGARAHAPTHTHTHTHTHKHTHTHTHARTYPPHTHSHTHAHSLPDVGIQLLYLNIRCQIDLTDVWRVINPEVLRFTWKMQNPLQQARPGFFSLVSENVMNYVKDIDIYVWYRSDHSLTGLELEFKNETR